MKYVKEMVIIFGITLAGEVLNQLIPLPVPAGVYGLFLLLGLLCSGIVSLPDVEHVGGLLLDLMPLMFIPAAVGIIVTIVCQILKKSDRDDIATIVSLAGLIIVLTVVLDMIADLFDSVRNIFDLF